jgi:6-phosphogluconolactonase (cycloisomerase 2 family)/enamine deaminase RidA (YjgF/YER057c/UK114 family)
MFLSIVLSLHLFLFAGIADTSHHDLYIGSYTKGGNPGIEVMEVNGDYSSVKPTYTIAQKDASYLTVTPDMKFLYAVSEQAGANGALSAFRSNAGGKFELLNSVPTVGGAPCFVAYREASKTLYTANYTGGSLTVFKTENGRLLPASQHIVYKGSSINKSRQEAPHAHNIVIAPDQNHLYVVDLGTDQIHQHRIFADGTVEEKAVPIPVKAGNGPRHMVFDKSGAHAYLINEMSGTVDVFTVQDGKFSLQQSLAADTAKAAVKGSADIHISPGGKWLLTSNRVTSNQLTVFSILADGSLQKHQHQEVGRHPRNFTFDPSGKYVLVASKDENRVQVFSFNEEDGSLSDTHRDIAVQSPVCLVFNPFAKEVDPEERIKSLNIQLIPPVAPIANYVKYVQTGNLVYLSGHGPDKPGGGQIYGKIGRDLTVEEGQAAARLTGISLISTLKGYIGDLNRVKRIVKVLGLVNSAEGFSQQPMVMNGFSNLMVEVFGDRGRHARSAVGVNALPNNIAVEIEMIVELK